MANGKTIFRKGIKLKPEATSVVAEAGELAYNTATGKYEGYTSTADALVQEDKDQELKNKDLEDSSTEVVDAADSTIKIKFDAAGTTGTSTTLLSSQTTNKTLTLPDATDTLVGKATTDTLTNKTLTTPVINEIVTSTNTNLNLNPNGTGKVTTDNLALSGSTLESTTGNLNLDPAGGFAIVLDGLVSVDGGVVDITGQLDVDNININDNTISSTNSNGHVNLTANGTGKVKVESGAGKGLDVQSAGAMEVGASVGANNLTLGGASSTVVIPGNLQVDGTTVTVNAATLEIEDANVLVNNGGNDASSEGAGLTVERTGTNGSIIYKDASATKFALGAAGSEVDVVGTSSAQALTNKTFSDAPILAEIATPSTPASGFGKIYFKANKLYQLNDLGAESQVGSGGGGGVNFVGLTTTFSPDNTDDRDAENSIGNWLAYADAAGSSPVDMTGGAPTVTIARTTTAANVLNGAAGFVITKDAANRQGEGCAVVANIPIGYRTSNCEIRMPFKIVSGTLVQGDLKLFVYDVTNSEVITPFNNDVIGSQGTAYAVFAPKSSTAQIRVGFHFAATTTTAVTLAFDDVFVGPVQEAMGMAGSDDTAVTLTPNAAGFGTTTLQSTWMSRVGDKAAFRGYFKLGTAAASSAYLDLPSNIIIDSAKFASTASVQEIGRWTRIITGGSSALYGGSHSGPIFYDGSDTNSVYFAQSSGSNILATANVTTIFATNDAVTYNFTIPVASWSSNITIANSSTFKISSFLANGTRVTTTPTLLGQYRSQIKDAAATTYTDSAPTASPNTSDGIRIYNGAAYNVGDSAGEVTRYEIFVGKNKQIKVEKYASSARTGYIDTSPLWFSTSANYGYFESYDPVTGVFAIVGNRALAGTSTHNSGYDSTGAVPTQDPYFDIIVSENALAVGVESVRSEVQVHTGNGHGSTNTKIRRFSVTQKNTGTAITYADSATLGGSFTINEDGVYSISYTDVRSGADAQIGISEDSNQLTTNIGSISTTHRIMHIDTPAAARSGNVTATVNLRAGQIIRAHTDATPDTASIATKFIITKVSN